MIGQWNKTYYAINNKWYNYTEISEESDWQGTDTEGRSIIHKAPLLCGWLQVWGPLITSSNNSWVILLNMHYIMVFLYCISSNGLLPIQDQLKPLPGPYVMICVPHGMGPSVPTASSMLLQLHRLPRFPGNTRICSHCRAFVTAVPSAQLSGPTDHVLPSSSPPDSALHSWGLLWLWSFCGPSPSARFAVLFVTVLVLPGIVPTQGFLLHLPRRQQSSMNTEPLFGRLFDPWCSEQSQIANWCGRQDFGVTAVSRSNGKRHLAD